MRGPLVGRMAWFKGWLGSEMISVAFVDFLGVLLLVEVVRSEHLPDAEEMIEGLFIWALCVAFTGLLVEFVFGRAKMTSDGRTLWVKSGVFVRRPTASASLDAVLGFTLRPTKDKRGRSDVIVEMREGKPITLLDSLPNSQARYVGESLGRYLRGE